MVNDPGVIMPRLHREGHSNQINSPFQSFLLSLKEEKTYSNFCHIPLNESFE